MPSPPISTARPAGVSTLGAARTRRRRPRHCFARPPRVGVRLPVFDKETGCCCCCFCFCFCFCDVDGGGEGQLAAVTAASSIWWSVSPSRSPCGHELLAFAPPPCLRSCSWHWLGLVSVCGVAAACVPAGSRLCAPMSALRIGRTG